MSETLEDLALELYGKDGAAKFFSDASKPRTWLELAANSETWSPCRTVWEFGKEFRRLREMRTLLASFAALPLEQAGENSEKIAGMEDYCEALDTYLRRSLTEYECGVVH